MSKDSLSFEQNLKKIEKIVEALKEEDLPLEKGVSMFKEGMKLLETCKQQLKKAQDEVKIYLEEQDKDTQEKNLTKDLDNDFPVFDDSPF